MSAAELFLALEDAEHLHALSRPVRKKRLLDLQDAAAKLHAEETFLRLTSTPDFIDGTVPYDVLRARLEGALDELIEQALKMLARHGVKDAVTRGHAGVRLIHEFYSRFRRVGQTPRGGSA